MSAKDEREPVAHRTTDEIREVRAKQITRDLHEVIEGSTGREIKSFLGQAQQAIILAKHISGDFELQISYYLLTGDGIVKYTAAGRRGRSELSTQSTRISLDAFAKDVSHYGTDTNDWNYIGQGNANQSWQGLHEEEISFDTIGGANHARGILGAPISAAYILEQYQSLRDNPSQSSGPRSKRIEEVYKDTAFKAAPMR